MINNSIQRTLKYLEKYIDFFLVAEKMDDDSENQMKSFVELIFLFNLLPDTFKKSNSLEFIRQFVWKKLSEVDIVKSFEEQVGALAGLAVIEQFCIENGKQKFRDYLVSIVEKQQIDLLLEKPPFRQMDVKYSLEKAKIKDNLPSYEELYSKTVFGNRLPLFYYTPSSMYSFTHMLFYVTDMGRNYYLEESKFEFVNTLKGLMGDRILARDLDVLGELVLCALFLSVEKEMENLLEFSIKFIVQNQNEDGSFPAPKEINYNNDYEKFRNVYHTTIVCLGVLLCYQEKILSKN